MSLVTVRVNGVLAQEVGTSRLQLDLPQDATVADLLDAMCRRYPTSSEPIRRAIPVIGGNHVSPSATVPAGREVSLLMPVSGG
jgi:molybdopterin synthase catalytic subunit